jgi:hypothetical protein
VRCLGVPCRACRSHSPGPCWRPIRLAINVCMTERRSDPEAGSPGAGAPAKPGWARQARLSAALRANLARRKAQAREREVAHAGACERYGDNARPADRPGQETHDSAGFAADKQTR